MVLRGASVCESHITTGCCWRTHGATSGRSAAPCAAGVGDFAGGLKRVQIEDVVTRHGAGPRNVEAASDGVGETVVEAAAPAHLRRPENLVRTVSGLLGESDRRRHRDDHAEHETESTHSARSSAFGFYTSSSLRGPRRR